MQWLVLSAGLAKTAQRANTRQVRSRNVATAPPGTMIKTETQQRALLSVAQRCSAQFCANVSLTAWARAGAATRMHSVALRERSRTLGTPAQRVRRARLDGLTLIKLRLRNGTFLQLTSTHSKP